MKSLAMISFSLVVALTLMTACTTTPASTPTPTPGPITITDDLNRTVTVAEIPQRIVSLSPSNTEILFALDLGDKVVGVTDFCDYPEDLLAKIDAGEIRRVGAPWPSFSLETIVSLDPDLAFAVGETVPDYVNDLESLGIPVVILQPHDIDDILQDIELVGEITGKETEADELIDEMEAHMVSTGTITASANTTPTVFYELDAFNPALPWTAGSGTFVDILISLAAGENIASAVEGWTTFDLEDLITSDPDMIILGDYPWVSPEDVMAREGWGTLRAIQNGSIYPINVDLVSRPGPRIFDGLEEMAKIIHPELFE